MRRNILIISLCVSTTFSFSQTPSLEIGSKAPDIHLPNPAGDTIALSALKGKIVLVDFWASWCGPCVDEQPQLVKLYRKYKHFNFTGGDGFEIYGVSLDNKKTAWLNEIHRLKIDWTQVSDLKYWSSPVAKTYNIQELPFNMLINGDGIIIAKNLHMAELQMVLTEMRN